MSSATDNSSCSNYTEQNTCISNINCRWNAYKNKLDSCAISIEALDKEKNLDVYCKRSATEEECKETTGCNWFAPNKCLNDRNLAIATCSESLHDKESCNAKTDCAWYEDSCIPKQDKIQNKCKSNKTEFSCTKNDCVWTTSMDDSKNISSFCSSV